MSLATEWVILLFGSSATWVWGVRSLTSFTATLDLVYPSSVLLKPQGVATRQRGRMLQLRTTVDIIYLRVSGQIETSMICSHAEKK